MCARPWACSLGGCCLSSRRACVESCLLFFSFLYMMDGWMDGWVGTMVQCSFRLVHGLFNFYLLVPRQGKLFTLPKTWIHSGTFSRSVLLILAFSIFFLRGTIQKSGYHTLLCCCCCCWSIRSLPPSPPLHSTWLIALCPYTIHTYIHT